jgi:hypothetical protein
VLNVKRQKFNKAYTFMKFGSYGRLSAGMQGDRSGSVNGYGNGTATGSRNMSRRSLSGSHGDMNEARDMRDVERAAGTGHHGDTDGHVDQGTSFEVRPAGWVRCGAVRCGAVRCGAVGIGL